MQSKRCLTRPALLANNRNNFHVAGITANNFNGKLVLQIAFLLFCQQFGN
jgi:hypothetical protein